MKKPSDRFSTRVKTARGRKLSSTRWLQRQLNDPHVAAARKAGYRSRAALKLEAMDDRHQFLKKGARVVDLGAAPGGWCQVAVRRTGGGKSGGIVIGVDLSPIEPIDGCVILQHDATEPSAAAAIREAAGGAVDVVLCDMAAPATGHRGTDHLRIMTLGEAAAEIACGILAEGGVFCCKMLAGGTEATLLAALKQRFAAVRHVKPPASRPDSAEIYLLATGFRG